MKNFFGFLGFMAVIAAIIYGITQYGQVMMPDEMQDGGVYTEDQCAALRTRFETVITQSLRCEDDSDCSIYPISCGLLLTCDMAVNTTFVGALDDIQSEYTRGACETQQACEPCPQYIKAPEARCENRFCRVN